MSLPVSGLDWRAPARAEMQRFWTRRARRAWLIAVILMEGLLVFALALTNSSFLTTGDRALVLSVCLHGLTHLVLWGSAWIGADLLSRQRADNPDPTYDPAPLEVFAGLAGRLVPFAAGYLALLITFAGACGIGAVSTSSLDAQLPVSSRDAPLMVWAGWLLVIWSGACAYGMIASMLSGILRRPKRLLITLTALIPGTVALCTATIALLTFGEFSAGFSAELAREIGVLGLVLSINPLCVGLVWGNELETTLTPNGPTVARALGTQMHALLFYLIVTAVCGAVLLGTASVRHRRTSCGREAHETGG